MIAITGYSDVVQIGQGGLGDVYRATRTSTGGVVAIKVLRDVSDESVVWHRTRRELTALVSLAGHAHVIQLIEMLDLDEGPALVMEFAPGGSITDLLQRRDEPLSVGETVLVGRHTAAALSAAHAQGIVHRDVKPQNLLIDAYGQVKLCDFGIAAMARADGFEDRTNAISMRYASPEDLDDEIDVGPPSDIYSLGATLLHLVHGSPPTLKQRLEPWLPPTTADSELSVLDEIVASCLQPVPAARPTAAQVVDELERLSWSMDERNRSIRTTDDADDGLAPNDGLPPNDGRATIAGGSFAVRAEWSDTPPATGEWAGAIPVPSLDNAADTEPTLIRPDRRPPPHPSPSPEPRRRGRRRMLTVIGVVTALAVAGTGLVWWSGRDSDARRLDVLMVDRPGGLADVTSLEWPSGPSGECLVQSADSSALEPIPCEEPHDLQRIAVDDLDPTSFPTDGPFDAASVHASVRSSCDRAFADVVGVEPADSEFDAPFSAPSVSTWASGDRTFQCLAGVSGKRLVGDVADSGR